MQRKGVFSLSGFVWAALVCTSLLFLTGSGRPLAQDGAFLSDLKYEHDETRELVALVSDAAELVRTKQEAAFADLRAPGSRWRQGETYIFVIDLKGNMLVHPDPSLEDTNQLALKDINGKPIIQGLIEAASVPGKPEGWYHYEWPVPGQILPRWKSTYVRMVTTASGRSYIVGSGVYNDRMERSFVVNAVKDAVAQIEQNGSVAYALFHDPTGPFIAKDAYIFVVDPSGVDLVNPGFPSLEGRNLLDQKDTQGKLLIREMFDVVQDKGSGWVDYMWPKPGESISTQKSAYVSKARHGDKWVMVGCGVYLEDAPRDSQIPQAMAATDLMNFVREGAALVQEKGEAAFPEFRTKDSKWFRDDTYLFVWSMDGKRVFHAADPAIEGQDVREIKDVLGRPYGKMALEAASGPSGEGWIHYMYPKPGDIFPAWKSTFVKRVDAPSGKRYLVGCGVYNMQMSKAFVEDVVNRAATLVSSEGTNSFTQLRDKSGPFVFMNTYVFVSTPDGVEWVNPAQPSLEGKNLIDVRDVNGKLLVREYIAAALKDGSAWVDYYWYKPGENNAVHKKTLVKKVQFGSETYIVGSGLYVE